MKYQDWKNVKIEEKDFQKSLMRLSKAFERIAKEANDDEIKFKHMMNKFQKSDAFSSFVDRIVKRMVLRSAGRSNSNWREAAKKWNKSKTLYSLLMKELRDNSKLKIDEQIEENAKLIKTLPLSVAEKVVKDIEENALKGKRASSVAKIIQSKTAEHSRASAALIARTEIAKTYSALTKIRSQELGLNWYIWRTSLDGLRVRKSHRNMENVLVNWNDPPSPEELVGEQSVGKYHAGNIWNCRCYSEPVVDVDDIKFPHRVYFNGQIKSMKKEEFLRLYTR